MRIILCMFALITFNCYGAIGTITDQVNKPPEISRSKEVLTGSKGTGVEMNDTINTGKGKIGITFRDNTKVQITENSKLVIDDFVYDPKTSKGGKLVMKVALGTVRYGSGQIAKNSPQNVSIDTPAATIAVRGTDFTATVDEIGASTIILLPSCPPVWRDIERDCVTGAITVSNGAGSVLLNKPFQATKVENRNTIPLKPVVLNLTEDVISNMLIVAPPKEILDQEKDEKRKTIFKNSLDADFLKENSLVNTLEMQQLKMYEDKLSRNLLEQNFLENLLDVIDAQMDAQTNNLLAIKSNQVLPDYTPTSGVVATIDVISVELCRSDGSNMQCVTTPRNQNTTIIQQQGSIEIKNRVNSGGGTNIVLRQN